MTVYSRLQVQLCGDRGCGSALDRRQRRHLGGPALEHHYHPGHGPGGHPLRRSAAFLCCPSPSFCLCNLPFSCQLPLRHRPICSAAVPRIASRLQSPVVQPFAVMLQMPNGNKYRHVQHSSCLPSSAQRHVAGPPHMQAMLWTSQSQLLLVAILCACQSAGCLQLVYVLFTLCNMNDQVNCRKRVWTCRGGHLWVHG